MSEVKQTHHDIQARLLQMVQQDLLQTSPGFNVETDLFANGLDSMAIMQFLLLIEEEFQVVIPVESVSHDNFKTVRAVTALVAERCGVTQEPETVPALQTSPVLEPEFLEYEDVSTFDADAQTGVFERLPLQTTDYFVVGFDHLLRSHGQHGHMAFSFLELDQLVDVSALKRLTEELPRRFSILNARVVPRWMVGFPEWRASAKAHIELRFWSQKGSKNVLAAENARTFEDVSGLLEDFVNTPLPRFDESWTNVRFDLVEKADGGCLFVFSWSHLIMDGVGAEFFLTEMERIWRGSKHAPAQPYASADSDPRGLKDRFLGARPMMKRFFEILEKPFESLGERKPEGHRTHFEVITLTEAQTQEATRRSSAISGPLVSMPFYLACAMRAHWAVFKLRGNMPPSLMTSVPVQVRKKGARGPIFQNHLTMFYGNLAAEELETLDGAARELQEQHARFLRERLGSSFRDMMWLTRPVPPALHVRLIQFQMKGLFSSFYHSHTGTFAPELDTFLGAKIKNAYHVPGISGPPGTGLFASERNGRLSLTLCWLENALSAEERKVFIEHVLSDLGV